jgi:hypothetical protein
MFTFDERARQWVDAFGNVLMTEQAYQATLRPADHHRAARTFVRCFDCHGKVEIVRHRAMPHVCRGGVVA